MKKYFKIASLFLIALFYSCTQPISFKNMVSNQTGYFMFGKEPGREFYIRRNLGDSLKQIWSAETSGSQNGTSVSIYNNIVFVTDLSGKLTAFDIENGKLFGYEKFAGAIQVAPVIVNLRLFLLVNDYNETYSNLVCFDFMNGKIQTESRIPGNVSNELLKIRDGIIAVSDDGIVYKFNLSGYKLWEIPTGVISKSIPATDGNNIFVLNQNGEIISLSSENGEINYRKKISDGFESGITIDGPEGYAGDNEGNVYCIRLKEGVIHWMHKTGTKIKSIPVFDEENIYTGNLAGRITCLNKFSGQMVWETETNGIVNATPLLFKDILVQPNINKHLDLIDKATGGVVKSIKFDTRVKMSPVFYDGMLFIGTDRGSIISFKPENTGIL